MKITKLKDTEEVLEVKVQAEAFYKIKTFCACNRKTVTEHAVKNGWITKENIIQVKGQNLNNKLNDIHEVYVFQKKLNKKENVPTLKKRTTSRKPSVKKDESK